MNKGYKITFSQLGSRLDATYYSPLKSQITKIIEDYATKGLWSVATIGEVSERVFFPNRFKRIYVSEEMGIPFLSGADITQWDLVNVKHLSKNTEDLETLLVRKDWILITRSGTVGVVVKVPKFLDNIAVTEHVIRVIPNTTKIDPGYLYALMNSEIGSALLKPGIHGSVVDEITPEYIQSLKIPLLSMKEQKEIGRLVAESDDCLTKAFDRVNSARRMLLEKVEGIGLNIHEISDEETEND